MKKPNVYICFGMPKSGSTLAFQLSRAVARQGGHRPDPKGEYIDERGDLTSVCRDWSAPMLERLIEASENAGRMIVIKTHRPPSEAVRTAVGQGVVRVQAVCRDPRDIALSMVDMGTKGDSWGRVGKGKIVRAPSDVRHRIADQIETFHQWADLSDALVLNYERVAFDTKGSARRIADHMDLRAWPWRVAREVRRDKSNFNKGKPLRHHSEMAASIAADWQEQFGDFIRTYCSDIPTGCLDRAGR